MTKKEEKTRSHIFNNPCCSFCGEMSGDVEVLIPGLYPHTQICEKCSIMCVETLLKLGFNLYINNKKVTSVKGSLSLKKIKFIHI